MKRKTFTFDWWFDAVFNCLLIPSIVSIPLMKSGVLVESIWGWLSVVAVIVLLRTSVLDRGLA